MSLETALVLSLIVSALLLGGAVWLLYRDGLFKDATGWLADDGRLKRLERLDLHLAAPRAQTKGFHTRNAKVVPLRASQPPRRATK